MNLIEVEAFFISHSLTLEEETLESWFYNNGIRYNKEYNFPRGQVPDKFNRLALYYVSDEDYLIYQLGCR